jgi:hypothetical protein
LNTASSVPLCLFPAIVDFSPKRLGKQKFVELIYYIGVRIFGRFVRGKTFLREEMPREKSVWRPYINENYAFDGEGYV